MSAVTHHHDPDRSNFLRAFRGEELPASEFISTGRRLVVVSGARRGDADDVAVIELPPAACWLHKDVTIIGTGFRLAPAHAENVQDVWIRREDLPQALEPATLHIRRPDRKGKIRPKVL
jgi:hypothetical protein